MNPFTRPPAGSYASPLIEGLLNIERPLEAEEFDKGLMKLAVVSSITGNVKTFKELVPLCIKALNTLEQGNTVNYYKYGLEHGEFVPASTNGAYVYDPQDPAAVAYVADRLKESGEEVINPYFSK